MDKKKQYGLTIDCFGNSHVGLVREENQDSFGKFPANSNDVYLPKGQLFVVADGIGGPAYGREASKSAIELIWQVFQKMPDDNIASTLKLAFETANSKIFNSFKGNTKFRKMGAAVTAMVIKGNRLYIAHVGNCRVYRISKNKIEVLTTDHSMIGEMKKKGIIKNEDEVTQSPNAILKKALGFSTEVEIDIIKNIVVHSGDSFVLCTDGLDAIEKDEIFENVIKYNAEVACDTLLNMAIKRGGDDSATLQVIKVSGHDTPMTSRPNGKKRAKTKSKFKLLLTAFLAFALTTFGILFYEPISKIFGTQNQIVVESKGINPETFDTKININKASIENLIYRGGQHFISGNLDSSAIFYNHVLQKSPGNKDANEALYIISQKHKEHADKLVDEARFSDALIIYQKAFRLQPADYEIAELISYCELQIESATDEPVNYVADTNPKREIQLQPADDTNNNYEEIEAEINDRTDVKYSFWKFNQIDDDDFSVRGNDVSFFDNFKMKKALNSYMLQGFTFEIDATYNNKPNSKRAGIIVGYNFDDNSNTDTYFLISISELGKLQLQKVTGNTSETLLSMPVTQKFNLGKHLIRLKVNCTENQISIFNNNVLLKSWANTYLIIGKVGLYADPYTNVQFTNFKLTPNL